MRQVAGLPNDGAWEWRASLAARVKFVVTASGQNVRLVRAAVTIAFTNLLVRWSTFRESKIQKHGHHKRRAEFLIHRYISRLKHRAEVAVQNPASASPLLQSNTLAAASQHGKEADLFDQPAKQSTNAQNASSNHVQANVCNGRQRKESQIFPEIRASNSTQQQERLRGPCFPSDITQLSQHGRSQRASIPEIPDFGVSSERQDETSAHYRAGTITSDATDTESFYGDSSTLSYIQAVQKSIVSGQSPTFASPTLSKRPQSTSDTDSTCPSQPGPQGLLPHRSLADELITSYFRHVHLLYPFLHRPSFQAQYERMWGSIYRQDEEWLALMNVVFALGIRFVQTYGNETTASDKFFGYARGLVSTEQMAKPTLQTLQLLLLQALYFQFTNRPNETWNAIGLAIRVATIIGAHVDPQLEQYNATQIEVRRRCWYGCVVLDS